jgi:hypothetical protein
VPTNAYQFVAHSEIVEFDEEDPAGTDQTILIGIDAPSGMAWAGYFLMIYVDPVTDEYVMSSTTSLYDVVSDDEDPPVEGRKLVVQVHPVVTYEPNEDPTLPGTMNVEWSPKIVVKAAATSLEHP